MSGVQPGRARGEVYSKDIEGTAEYAAIVLLTYERARIVLTDGLSVSNSW